ncbi:hypothetical protein LIER_35726 [Lithospermum erythrorhizon]|uniref:Retrovirus-related Pol polyprotein from transposon RE1 n=1 Tax=Lithospermum erythrorhizon TaxID=34254 RepID=A0AAV3NVG4_LITER
MLGCRASSSPLKLGNKDHMFEGEPVEISPYQQLVRKLIYLSHTKPDIAFAISLVSQYMHKPCQEHLDAVYRILKYLKQAPGKGLFFKKSGDRTTKTFTDADWTGSVDDKRSTSRYCALSAINIAHNPVQHDRTKHVEVDKHFIKEKLDRDVITIKHVPTGQQVADVLTKGLAKKQFSLLMRKLAFTNIYRPA